MIDEMMRLAALQQRVFRCIEDELRRDPYHKSYEGRIEATMELPDIFSSDRTPSWTVSLSCYVLPIDGRHRSWCARTLAEAIAKAEQDIERICSPYEMVRFERDIGMCCDEASEKDGTSTVYGAPRPGADPSACPPQPNLERSGD